MRFGSSGDWPDSGPWNSDLLRRLNFGKHGDDVDCQGSAKFQGSQNRLTTAVRALAMGIESNKSRGTQNLEQISALWTVHRRLRKASQLAEVRSYEGSLEELCKDNIRSPGSFYSRRHKISNITGFVQLQVTFDEPLCLLNE